MQIPTYKPPHTFIFLLSFWPLILPTQSLPSFCISNKTTWHSCFFLQDGGRESHTFRPEVKRFWIWGAAVSGLQWLLTPCLNIPISAAFLHSWEMCLLPGTLCCQTWSSLCCLGTFQNEHEKSMFASRWSKVELYVEWQNGGETNEEEKKCMFTCCAIQSIKRQMKNRASFHRLELMS